MRSAVVFLAIAFLSFLCLANATVEVEWACRDGYLWLHVLSKQTVQFEAIDPNGVHPISSSLASRCGYTVSTFKAGGFTTFRASYYSCFTLIQDDQVFTFQFNVMVSDGGSEWMSQSISAVCSGLSLVQREIMCEEDYMEVNVQREASCGAQPRPVGQTEHAALSQALKTASWASQLMFLEADGHRTSLSIADAESQGYTLSLTAKRAVLRAPYKTAKAQLIQVDGVPVVSVGVFLFYKTQLMVVMIDMSMACTVNSASFDGVRLVWDVPRVPRPLLDEGAAFKSLKRRLEVGGVMLDELSAAAKGFNLLQQEQLVRISVPFGAEGGYKKSLVVNNMYKETFVISLLYEHRFLAEYQDGGSVETKVRLVRVLETPQLCRPPFSLNQTAIDEGVFGIYLGNVPGDVILEKVQVNHKQMAMEATEGGLVVTPVVHLNGSRAYKLHLAFSNAAVRRMYMGEGLVQYSIDVNFTLTKMPEKESYYHHTLIIAQVLSAYPPKITAQCLDRGMVFSMAVPPGAESLWEVGVDQEPLTPQLAAQRGYKLLNDSQQIVLEVPVFSIGYTYDDINLSNFYGTFKLLLRDAKTLEVQTSTSKHCLFKTEDMIVCSADGIITVVTTPTATWPTVHPGRTTLLDPTCRPKETDATRVLFQFKLDSCGTRITVGDYMLYENEILHDRRLIADGANFISRDSQFKLTVRCFYPLSGINRLMVDRVSRAKTTGFGSIDVFGSLTDPKNLPPDCLQQLSRHAMISQSETEQARVPEVEPERQNEIKLPSQQTEALPNEDVPTPPPSTSPNQNHQEEGFPLKYNYLAQRHFQPSHGYDYSVPSFRPESSAPRRNWAPVSQREFIKPNEPRWNSKTQPSEGHRRSGPYHAVQANRYQRPGNAPHVPVPQNSAEFSQIPSNTVQNIRVKPQSRLLFPNHNQQRFHSGETAASRGKMSSIVNNVVQMPGPSQSMNGPAFGGFLAPVSSWSRGVSSLSGPVKDAPVLSVQELSARDTDEKKVMEGNMGSTASQMASGVKPRSSNQKNCRSMSDQYEASVHHGIIRGME
ncbi:uncharacterized protein [Syngnathus scovelli]|uniref:uncharacterized protein n=1 Tax=Syngnathus scovelli TaxID=161590 RepID=UPI002110B5E7|nr:uncharacterized protein LOC125990406 [Syngnathus scovelli]